MLRRYPALVMLAAVAAVFTVDFLTPVSAAIPLLYIVGIWLSYYLPAQRWIWITAAFVSVFIVIGYFLSPRGPAPLWLLVANRVIAISAIWFTAFLFNRVRQSLAEQSRLKAILETRVEERTAQLFATEERLNLALKSSGVGTWSWNVVENSLIWDDFTLQLFGLQRDTVPAQNEDFLKARTIRKIASGSRKRWRGPLKKMRHTTRNTRFSGPTAPCTHCVREARCIGTPPGGHCR